ncbi:MAG: twin-arginine translocase TatA/TatE family subunit [Deltaproteobacteria bacterium]|nr:twin-arginine translocase TatA/TatE family subunit [Deltaproteobacteria bacterium]
MFGIDFEVLVLLAVLAFILFGPEKLPEYAAKFGYYVAKLREASSDLTRQAQASFNNPLQPPPAQPAIGATDHTLATPTGAYEHTCPVCAHLVSHDFMFCPKCGAHLKEEAVTPQAPHQPLAS